MFRNRSGRPRSRMSSAGLAVSAAAEISVADRASGAFRVSPRPQRQQRRAPRQPAGEQVPPDLALPDRRLDDRLPVVGARLPTRACPPIRALTAGHRSGRRPRPAPARPRPRPPRATSRAGRGSCRRGRAAGRTPPARPAAGRTRRTRRRRRRDRRRTAARPATPSACSVASRSSARARSSSSCPYWIDSVGQACAHAGVMPSRVRS